MAGFFKSLFNKITNRAEIDWDDLEADLKDAHEFIEKMKLKITAALERDKPTRIIDGALLGDALAFLTDPIVPEAGVSRSRQLWRRA